MKVTVTVPNSVLQLIIDQLLADNDIVVTLDELKANPILVAFIENDMDVVYFDAFADRLHTVDFADELDLKA